MYDSLYIECDCGQPDHLVRFYRYVDEDSVELGINVQMSPYLSWWRRIVVAVKYILGAKTRCHWSDAYIKDAQREKIVAFINETPLMGE